MIRWGILGTGNIARDFVLGLRHVPGATLQAIGSRSAERSEVFAKTWGAARSWGSYEALVSDPEVDVVYVATPHHSHAPDCLLALNAGKAVLCEKPFAQNAAEARAVFDLARSKNLFCMEALWTRFLPAVQKAKAMADAGAIGKILHFTADFGFQVPFEAESRYFDVKLGGGALLDRGVYPVSLAHFFLGKPDRVQGMALTGTTGVDEHAACLLGFPGGATALLSASLRVKTANEVMIFGETGTLRLHAPIYRPHRLTWTKNGPPFSATSPGAGLRPESLSEKLLAKNWFKQLFFRLEPRLRGLRNRDENMLLPFKGNGYGHEAAEVVRCLNAGLTESEIMPRQATLEVLEVLDRIRERFAS